MSNKTRLLTLIEILKRESDAEHPLSLNEIIALLENKDIYVERKTLYQDFYDLDEFGLEVEYLRPSKKYFLDAAPFTLSEIKIMIDSLSSLKNLDDKSLKEFKNKLYSFISTYDENFLEEITYNNKHLKDYLIIRMEMILTAIRKHTLLKINYNNKKVEEIFPIFLHRNNDYYYLYYHYENNANIYHYRLDRIKNIDYGLDNKIDSITISKTKIKETITSSIDSFTKKEKEAVQIEVLEDKENIINRLLDDFNDAIVNKNKVTIKTSTSKDGKNEILFGKLVNYGNKIKISKPKNVKNAFKKYLQEILKNYRPEK